MAGMGLYGVARTLAWVLGGGGKMNATAIEALTADAMRTTALQDLCELVRDAVSGAASVGWVAVPSALEASTYWRGVADQVQSGARPSAVLRNLIEPHPTQSQALHTM